MQALEAIKILLNIGEPLIGRLLIFDALTAEFHELRLRKNPACPVCGEHPTVTGLIDYEEFCGVPHTNASVNGLPAAHPVNGGSDGEVSVPPLSRELIR